MVLWKCPVLEEVALGADASEGVWAQAQQRSGLRAVPPTSRSVTKTPFSHRIADRLGERLAGSFEAIRGHSPLPDILAATETTRAAGTDLPRRARTHAPPTRLCEHDISRAELPAIAAEALTDRVIRGNPRDRRHRRHSRDPRAGVVTVGWAVDAPCTTMTLY